MILRLQIPNIMQQSPDTWGLLLDWMQKQAPDTLFMPADLYVANVKAQRESVQATLKLWASSCPPEPGSPVEEVVADT